MRSEGSGWSKSSYSPDGAGACIETSALPGDPLRLALRDSKHPRLGHLDFTTREWAAFVAAARDAAL